jgi:hypothetical protein
MVFAGQLRVLQTNAFMAIASGIYAFDRTLLMILASRLNVDQESLSITEEKICKILSSGWTFHQLCASRHPLP